MTCTDLTGRTGPEDGSQVARPRALGVSLGAHLPCIERYPPWNLPFANWKMDENGPFIVDLPAGHGDFPVRYVDMLVYQRAFF